MSIKEKLNRLEQKLLIEKTALDSAALHQPSLYYEIGELEAQVTSERDMAKRDMEEVEAKTSSRLRKIYAEDKKFTERKISELVLQDARYKESQQEYFTQKHLTDRVSALKSAFEQRSSMLKMLANLYVANYFTTDSVRGNSPAGDMAYRAGRQKLKDARTSQRKPQQE